MEEQKIFKEFTDSLHRLGRITMVLMIGLLLMVPVAFGLMNGLSPNWAGFLSGVLKVGIIYYPTAVVEFLVYTPMLGTGGSYLSFITGNVTNMRIPCAMNAANIAKTQPGTAEHEIITTIAVAVSAITTTLVILLGVVLLVPLQPVLQSPALQPAFDNVVPALFGALGLKYFAKSIRLSAPPLVLMSLLCISMPSLINQTGTMMLPTGALALVLGYLLWKKDKL
ncbi:MAG: hypothetical protein IJ960_03630 [Oscillospiraceae bacterium]|nr:hypothetical protein [Oscillospiraceae bacterium]